MSNKSSVGGSYKRKKHKLKKKSKKNMYMHNSHRRTSVLSVVAQIAYGIRNMLCLSPF